MAQKSKNIKNSNNAIIIIIFLKLFKQERSPFLHKIPWVS